MLALVALAFGLLGLVIWRNRDKIREVFSRPLDLRLLALALAIYLVGIVSTFVRWYLLVRVIEPRFTLRAAVLLGFIGIVFNLVIPGAVGGDLIKAAYLVRMHIKKTQAIASMVIDRILGLLGLFILASIAGGLVWATVPSDVRPLILAAWVATGMGVLLLAAIFAQVLTRLFPGLGRGHSRLAPDHRRADARCPRPIAAGSTWCGICGAMSVCNHSLNVLAFYLVGRCSFPTMTTTIAQHFLMVPLTLFTHGRAPALRGPGAQRGGRRPALQAGRPPQRWPGDDGLPRLDVRRRPGRRVRLPRQAQGGARPDGLGAPDRGGVDRRGPGRGRRR